MIWKERDMQSRRFSILLLGCLAIAGCVKAQSAAEEQPLAPQQAPAATPAERQSVDEAEEKSSAGGLWGSAPSRSRTFPLLGTVTQIVITGRHNETLRTIEDREQIQTIVTFVDKQRSGWGHPWAGIPVPRISANFYDGDTFKGHFGAGPSFFGTQREGDFASKSVSPEQCQAFLRLIGVDKQAFGN
jgi:hypothetical protein